MSSYLDLYDYRLRVRALYDDRNRELAAGVPPETVWDRFRAGRDDLFASHPQSALDAETRRDFRGLRYFPYDPDAVVTAAVQPLEGDAGLRSPGEDLPLVAVALLRFTMGGREGELTLYWIDVYGGGLFLPFRDGTSGRGTYGGGRYLVDTVKGSVPLPGPGDDLVLDFNYAYNPSCAYHHRWVCPLAPPGNRLEWPVQAGEMSFEGEA